MIKKIRRLPTWSIVVICLSVLIVIAGLTTPWIFESFFESSVGSFVSNIIAEIVGILVGALFVFYVINSYMERTRVSKLKEQRDPYLVSLESGLRLSLNALCLVMQCPFLDEKLLQSDMNVTKGRENEINTWFVEIKEGEPLPHIPVNAIVDSLQYMINYSLKTPLEDIRAISHLFDDDPTVIRDISRIAHSVHTAIVYFRRVDIVTSDGQNILGTVGAHFVDLLIKLDSLKQNGVSEN